jgi:hypothetical protein
MFRATLDRGKWMPLSRRVVSKAEGSSHIHGQGPMAWRHEPLGVGALRSVAMRRGLQETFRDGAI